MNPFTLLEIEKPLWPWNSQKVKGKEQRCRLDLKTTLESTLEPALDNKQGIDDGEEVEDTEVDIGNDDGTLSRIGDYEQTSLTDSPDDGAKPSNTLDVLGLTAFAEKVLEDFQPSKSNVTNYLR
uniref:Uncharacterized protein n=1 Tax=Steinernema glaseri TaxID=37863 RepID=A0A1I8AUH0_9BILA